jgi:hypothetical protein
MTAANTGVADHQAALREVNGQICRVDAAVLTSAPHRRRPHALRADSFIDGWSDTHDGFGRRSRTTRSIRR